VFGDPYVSDAVWTNHQRIHQYRGGHRETWGGVALDVDSDYVDGAVVGATSGPAPPATETPVAIGAASTDDGVVSASWPAAALGSDAEVALGHSVPGVTLPGYGSGGYAVQLGVTTTSTFAPVRAFAAPVTLSFEPQPGPLAPLYSRNGTVWRHVPQLVDGALGPGARTGYARGGDGAFTIQTTVDGTFALVPDRIPPGAPALLTARFVAGRLAVAWSPSTDRNGPIAGYAVTLTNAAIASLPRGAHRLEVSGFHRHAPSVYRVVAVDAAGNESRPSKPVVVLPSARPQKLPKAIPAWAWRLLRWQAGRAGPRPQAPRIVPGWYWRWAAWQTLPFHLRR
jgi:hypothetical protein